MSYGLALDAKELENLPHPWKETRDWHSEDRIIRKAGFTIVSRPKRGEPTWIRRGATKPIGHKAALEASQKFKNGQY